MFRKNKSLVKISELTVMLAGKLDPVILVISNFLNVYFDCNLYKLQNENEVLFLKCTEVGLSIKIALVACVHVKGFTIGA